MLKKYTAILLMFTAYAILLGHNIIPHHHHDNLTELTQHHQSDHHDHDEDNNGLSHLFSHFIHSADNFTFPAYYSINNTISKQLFLLIAVLPDNFHPDEFFIPPLLYKPPAEHFMYISPHSLSSGLRAPPAFVS